MPFAPRLSLPLGEHVLEGPERQRVEDVGNVRHSKNSLPKAHSHVTLLCSIRQELA